MTYNRSSMFKPENLITRINYIEISKTSLPLSMGIGAFILGIPTPAMVAFGAAFAIGESQYLSEQKGGRNRHRLTRIFFDRSLGGSLTRGLIASTVFSLAYYHNRQSGPVLDPKIYAAVAAGGLIGLALDRTARALYDSELTMPIYRFLGIQDRRLTTKE